MSQSPGSIYEIRWRELFPWLILVKSLRASLFLWVLVIAWVGVLITQGGWLFIEGVFSEPVEVPRIAYHDPLADHSSPALLLDVAQNGDRIFRTATDAEISSTGATRWLLRHLRHHETGPLSEGWSWLGAPLVRIFRMKTPLSQACQLLLCGFWAIAVWALAGGAIARIAAHYLTRGDVIGPLAALKSAATKWSATAGAPLIGLLFAGLLAFPLALMGVLLRVDLFALIAGLLWGLYLVWGILLAVVLVALWFGWPLAWAAIGVERSDAFDAASRATAYVYQRPLRLGFYIAVASLLGIVGHLIVAGFATAGSELTDWAVSWGAGSERTAALVTQPLSEDNPVVSSGSAITGARAIYFWKGMLSSLAASYPLAFLWTASVGIYLLLRHHIDATEMDEIVGDPGEDIGSPRTTKAEEPAELSTRRSQL